MTMTDARRLLVRARKWMDPNLDQDARDIDAWLAANPESTPDAGVTEAIAALDECFFNEPDVDESYRKRWATVKAAIASAVPAAPAGRTPEQFAIEHGRYLVTAVEALLRRVGRGVPVSGDDYLAVRSAIHEFTKRADRAYAPPSKDTAPAVAVTSPGETAGNKGD